MPGVAMLSPARRRIGSNMIWSQPIANIARCMTCGASTLPSAFIHTICLPESSSALRLSAPSMMVRVTWRMSNGDFSA